MANPGHSSGGGGMYIAGVIILVLAIGGIVWKLKSTNDAPPPVPTATIPKPVPTPTLALVDPPPPPPPEIDAGPVVAATGKAGGGGGGGPTLCGGNCTGSANGALTSALSGRAGSARGCYERALRVNAQLQGKLTVGVRVDPFGSVCSASITQDGVHSSDVSSCVIGMFRGAKFPAPSGGCVDVNVPLSFVPREK